MLRKSQFIAQFMDVVDKLNHAVVASKEAYLERAARMMKDDPKFFPVSVGLETATQSPMIMAAAMIALTLRDRDPVDKRLAATQSIFVMRFMEEAWEAYEDLHLHRKAA